MSTEQRGRRPSPALSVGANATFFTVVFIFKDPTPVFNQRLLLSLKHPGVWLSRARFAQGPGWHVDWGGQGSEAAPE